MGLEFVHFVDHAQFVQLPEVFHAVKRVRQGHDLVAQSDGLFIAAQTFERLPHIDRRRIVHKYFALLGVIVLEPGTDGERLFVLAPLLVYDALGVQEVVFYQRRIAVHNGGYPGEVFVRFGEIARERVGLGPEHIAMDLRNIARECAFVVFQSPGPARFDIFAPLVQYGERLLVAVVAVVFEHEGLTAVIHHLCPFAGVFHLFYVRPRLLESLHGGIGFLSDLVGRAQTAGGEGEAVGIVHRLGPVVQLPDQSDNFFLIVRRVQQINLEEEIFPVVLHITVVEVEPAGLVRNGQIALLVVVVVVAQEHQEQRFGLHILVFLQPGFPEQPIDGLLLRLHSLARVPGVFGYLEQYFQLCLPFERGQQRKQRVFLTSDLPGEGQKSRRRQQHGGCRQYEEDYRFQADHAHGEDFCPNSLSVLRCSSSLR